MNETVVVVTGAVPLREQAVAEIPHDAIVIAADGALDHALAAGLRPTGLVGDLDSITPDGLAWAQQHATIAQHDPDKDHTDTELALRVAADLVPRRLVLVSGGGDRIDHAIAAVGALGHPALTTIPEIDGWWGDQRFHVLHGPGKLTCEIEVGAIVSLLATHGTASGVTITGVRWPLDNSDISPLVGRGISNEVVDEHVEIRLHGGVLTIFVHAHG